MALRPAAWQLAQRWAVDCVDSGGGEPEVRVGTYADMRETLLEIRAKGGAGYLFPALYLDCDGHAVDELTVVAEAVARGSLGDDCSLVLIEETYAFVSVYFTSPRLVDLEPGRFLVQLDRCSGVLWTDEDHRAFARLGMLMPA